MYPEEMVNRGMNNSNRFPITQLAGDENGEAVRRRELETSLEERVEELLHRLRIEAAVVAGAKNVIRILQNNKVPDKKALHEVSAHFAHLFFPTRIFYTK